jgi:lipoma-prefererred partner
MFKKCILH